MLNSFSQQKPTFVLKFLIKSQKPISLFLVREEGGVIEAGENN